MLLLLLLLSPGPPGWATAPEDWVLCMSAIGSQPFPWPLAARVSRPAAMTAAVFVCAGRGWLRCTAYDLKRGSSWPLACLTRYACQNCGGRRPVTTACALQPIVSELRYPLSSPRRLYLD